MNNMWKFAKIERMEELMFNSSLEKFYNFKISGIVRENIQNSLDAKIKESKAPVLVTINIGEVQVNVFPGIEEILARIPYLKGANEYTKETIENMKNVSHKKIVKYISFEDQNTKGLKYISDDIKGEKDTWKAYAYKKGVHSEDSDQENEMQRGGSHGIGKIASNAASDLFLIYFANCDDKGNKYLGGTIQLIEHNYQDICYRSTGYFTESFEQEIPFRNTYDGIFDKSTRGLKLIIPFYRESFGTKKDIIKSVCDNFFVAILKEKLKVIVDGEIIDKDTIDNFISDKNYYEEMKNKRDQEMTPEYFKTYTSYPKENITIEDKKKNKYIFDLYFRYDENITKGRVAIIRSIGMKIEDFKVPSCATKPFNAVLIPRDLNCDKFLKSLENESHTELSDKHFKKKEHAENAKKFINNLNKVIRSILDEHIKQNNQTDGMMETDDILYEVENNFKQSLNESSSIYDTGLSKIIKRKPEKRKKEKKKTAKKPDSPTKKINDRTRKPKVTNENGERAKDETYKVTSHYVKRALISDREIMEIDLSTSSDIKENQKVDLVIKVIDGMGKEYDQEFKAEKSYSSVLDKSNGEKKVIENNKIKDISVKDKKIKLDLTLKQDFNKSLKFRYYLEV